MPATKIDLFREHKDEYATPKAPALVKTKAAKYLTIDGQGEPGGAAFTARVGALYAVAYTLKMRQKAAGHDYKVCPLEGLWWHTPGDSEFLEQPRQTWQWKLLIRTPDFVTLKDLKSAVAELQAKGKDAPVADVRLEKIGEGACVQALHVGSYASEPATIAQMLQFARARGLAPHGRHHEIYLSAPGRVPEARMRTILRIPVGKQ